MLFAMTLRSIITAKCNTLALFVPVGGWSEEVVR